MGKDTARVDRHLHPHDCGAELLARHVGVEPECRVTDIEKTVSAIEKKLAVAERLVRVETKTDGILASLSEIRETLRRAAMTYLGELKELVGNCRCFVRWRPT